VDIGARLLVALVEAGDTITYRKLALKEDFFLGPETELFKFVNQHVAKYSTLPKSVTLTQAFPGLPGAVEPVGYYADQVEHRYAHRLLNRALVACTEHMKGMDTFTTKNVLTEALIELRGVEVRSSLAEFTVDAHDLYMGQYTKKQTEDIPEVLTGWPALDKYGGLRSGDVLSMIGRPALGKTFSLLYTAVQAAFVQGLRVLFISLEMPLMEIMERLVAMYAHFPMDHIQNYELTSAQLKKLPVLLINSKDEKGKLWVLDGNFASTLEDVFALVYQLNPSVLIIDGAYLMRHADTRLDRYRRAEVNMELLKRRASEFGIPALQSYQFNRQAAKKMKLKGEHGGLEDIAFSDSIGQISSVVLGMFEDESVENVDSRLIHVLKGRKGQTGEFRINWRFDTMDFSQIMDDEQKKAGTLQLM
jgi:replicative DNA helicase